MRLSPWWLLAAAIAPGAALTGIVAAVGSEHLTALDWLGTTATVAAVVIAVGIYRLQERSGNEAHQELMEQLEAQGELLNDYAERAAEKDEAPALAPAQDDPLTASQRTSVEEAFGKDSIADAIDPGRRGRGGRGAPPGPPPRRPPGQRLRPPRRDPRPRGRPPRRALPPARPRSMTLCLHLRSLCAPKCRRSAFDLL